MLKNEQMMKLIKSPKRIVSKLKGNKADKIMLSDVSPSLSWNIRCMLCLLPSLLGIVIFFFWPFIRVLYYSVINNQFHKKLVGLSNYIDTVLNPHFQLAMKNSLMLILIGVPLLVVIALVLSLLLAFYLNRFPRLRDAFILPMLIPTASIVLIWQQLFSGFTSSMPIYLLFIWKNIGICIILLTAALTTIDKSMFEAAKIDGAKTFHIHRKITIPVIMPTIFFTVLLSIVNSFKIFKESYLYYGNKYPPDHSYTLQYYMNNNFLKFDYQALASSSVLTSVLILCIVVVGLRLQRRYQS